MTANAAHSYKAQGPFKNGHFNTLYAHFFSQRKVLPYQRERLQHPQGFSLFLDWVQQGNDDLVIFTHGLESSSNARYITSMGAKLLDNGFDVLAWNCRNCAEGETAESHAYYHSGISEDLATVIDHCIEHYTYRNITLVGFSMGGNIVLKYLGETSQALPKAIQRAVAISTPLDLLSCSHKMLRFPNQIYGRNFLKTILQKVQLQQDDLAHYNIELNRILQCKNLRDFDHAFTAPVHGFQSQDDYYNKASSLPLLKNITIPTLLINAKDDPILSNRCYPSRKAIANGHIRTLYPRHGGHIGFHSPNSDELNWLDNVTVDYIVRR